MLRDEKNTLWKVTTDGNGQTKIGGNTTKSTPAPTADSIFFQGTDDALWRFFQG